MERNLTQFYVFTLAAAVEAAAKVVLSLLLVRAQISSLLILVAEGRNVGDVNESISKAQSH